LISRHDSTLTTYAALWRIKMQRESRFDDFRVEVFSRRPRETSLYVRGFLGQSALKAIVRGDSLQAYFVRDQRYFHGTRADLDTLSLHDSEPVVLALLAIMRGSLSPPSDSLWELVAHGSRSKLDWRLHERRSHFEVRVRGKSSEAAFPHIRISEIELISADKKFRARIDIQSASFNRDLPAEKFMIEMAPSATSMTRDELVDLLTGLSP
jgi:hypothetical protein